jgi:hypothetical protein
MAVRCAVLLFAAFVVAGFARFATAADRPTDVAAGRCGKWAVPARIGGNLVCLKDNQRCAVRLGAQYRRYGFLCDYGVLLTRWESLRTRPLDDRRIVPGEPCPVTTETGRANSYPGLGPGPAYPMGTSNVITMRMPPPEGWGPEWSGTKRVWILDSRYASRALVRGYQLDGPNEMRFVLGRPGFTPAKILNPIRELRVEGNTPSLTRLRAPGCYAYQVDGRTFNYLIVLEARIEPTEAP